MVKIILKYKKTTMAAQDVWEILKLSNSKQRRGLLSIRLLIISHWLKSPKIRSVPTRNSGGTLQEALKFSGRDVSIVWDGKEIGTWLYFFSV